MFKSCRESDIFSLNWGLKWNCAYSPFKRSFKIISSPGRMNSSMGLMTRSWDQPVGWIVVSRRFCRKLYSAPTIVVKRQFCRNLYWAPMIAERPRFVKDLYWAPMIVVKHQFCRNLYWAPMIAERPRFVKNLYWTPMIAEIQMIWIISHRDAPSHLGNLQIKKWKLKIPVQRRIEKLQKIMSSKQEGQEGKRILVTKPIRKIQVINPQELHFVIYIIDLTL